MIDAARGIEYDSRMMQRSLSLAAVLLALILPIRADEAIDEAMIARFKVEGFQHSRVMETLTDLMDSFGARLRGSPSYAAAADWAKQRLNEFGVCMRKRVEKTSLGSCSGITILL